MGEEFSERKEFIGRIGTFFILTGLFAVLLFISSDISRSNEMQQKNLQNTALAGVALATREAGAALALALNQPSPTLVPVENLRATQDYVIFGVQSLQTRDAGAQQARLLNLPTPTLVPPEVLVARDQSISYFSLFCFGTIGITLGLILRRMTAPPAKTSNRFEGLRKWAQKRREAKARREAAQKEKAAQKKK